MQVHDVCIIGAGGIVGSAIARELSQRGFSVVGLEKHAGPAAETSGLNSCVVHSGFHEQRGTLKRQFAHDGSERLVQYARSKGIRLLKTGMLIAVPRGSEKVKLWRELRSLWKLWRGGREQHIPFQWITRAAEIRKIAPIDAFAGIYIPSVHVVDVMQLITSLQRDAIEGGAELHYNAPVTRLSRQVSLWSIPCAGREIHARILINSAGLGAPDVSLMAGGPRYSVEYYRGDYYRLAGGVARWNVRTLIYPAMPARSPSKGIHFGPRTDGQLFIGPNAVRVPNREIGLEMHAPKDVFLKAAQKFLPEMSERDIEWSHSGLRSKYTRADGVSDFLIRVDSVRPKLINLIGIDSPGLSSSMAIAEYVSSLCETKQDQTAA